MDAKENNPHHFEQLMTTNTLNSAATTTPCSSTNNSSTCFENTTPNSKLNISSSTYHSAMTTDSAVMINSGGGSSQSLNRRSGEFLPTMASTIANTEDMAVESTALLETTTAIDEQQHRGEHDPDMTTAAEPPHHNHQHQQHMLADEFEQFILNRTTSDSNILESSIYSELQFPPSLHGSSIMIGLTGHGGGYVSTSGGPITASSPAGGGTPAQMAGPQTPAAPSGRTTKRTKRKHKTKSKCTATAASLAAAAAAGQRASPTGHYPPRYTAIFMDPHHHQYGNVTTSSATAAHHHSGNAANALGQIASAAASSPFLNGSMGVASEAAYMQQFQYFQQRPMVTTMAPMPGSGHRRHHRSLFDATTTTTSALGIDNPLGGLSNASSPSVPAAGISPPLRLSFRKWFSRPSLPFVIGILALGGVACTLGGIVLGSTGLIEHSTQYLSAALLMIGIGVSLLVISGAIWRLSLPDDVDECPCYRHMEMCRNCNSPYCNSRIMAAGGYLYPEFQHRPPPPSYLTSLNECAGMSLLFHPTASAQQAAHYSTIRVNTPPPLYRSTNSLSVFGSSNSNNGAAPQTSTLVPSNTTTSSVGIVPDHSVITMSNVMENLQAQQQQQQQQHHHLHHHHHQTQPLIKEFNYLELD
ncbi:uncharacterized protein isoform X2 [Musca autumnalis]